MDIWVVIAKDEEWGPVAAFREEYQAKGERFRLAKYFLEPARIVKLKIGKGWDGK